MINNLHIFLFISNSCHLLEIQVEFERGYINFYLPYFCGTNVDQYNNGCRYSWSILGKVQDNHLDVTGKCSWSSIDDFGCNSTDKITSNVRKNNKTKMSMKIKLIRFIILRKCLWLDYCLLPLVLGDWGHVLQLLEGISFSCLSRRKNQNLSSLTTSLLQMLELWLPELFPQYWGIESSKGSKDINKDGWHFSFNLKVFNLAVFTRKNELVNFSLAMTWDKNRYFKEIKKN